MRNLLALAALAVVSGANAQANYSPNFDALALANLAGQDGWTAGSGTGGVVTNNASLSPSNSVFLTNTVSSFNSVGHVMAIGAPSVNTQILTGSANVRVNSVAGADRYFGIGFGTSGLATSGFIGVALGGNGLRGNGGSYASFNGLTNDLLQSRITADFVGRWVNISFTANRALTTNNVVFTFSGLGTGGGAATETFTKSVNFGTTNLTHAQIFTDWDGTSAVAGNANVDDVRFGANPVPEPATMAALGLGVAAMLRRRKKS